MNRFRKGFTIVELLIVVVVIAILAVIAVVAYNGITSQAHDARVKSTLSAIQKEILLVQAEGDLDKADKDALVSLIGTRVSTPSGGATKYPALIDIENSASWDCSGGTCRQSYVNFTYTVYMKSQSGAVYILDEGGIQRLKDEGVEEAKERLEDDIRRLERSLAFDTIGRSSDPAAECSRLVDAGLWYDDCAEKTLNQAVLYADMLESSNPMDVCVGRMALTGLSMGDCEWAVDGIDAGRDEISSDRQRLVAFRADLERVLSEGYVYRDAWDVNMTCSEACEYTSRSPLDSRYRSGNVYIFDSKSNLWKRAYSQDYSPQ